MLRALPCVGRASLEDMFCDYLALLPRYRGISDLCGVQMQRAFFGFVPNWLAPAMSYQGKQPVHALLNSQLPTALCFCAQSAAHKHAEVLSATDM